jgi:hypothetical protein
MLGEGRGPLKRAYAVENEDPCAFNETEKTTPSTQNLFGRVGMIFVRKHLQRGIQVLGESLKKYVACKRIKKGWRRIAQVLV